MESDDYDPYLRNLKSRLKNGLIAGLIFAAIALLLYLIDDLFFLGIFY